MLSNTLTKSLIHSAYVCATAAAGGLGNYVNGVQAEELSRSPVEIQSLSSVHNVQFSGNIGALWCTLGVLDDLVE